MTKDFTRRAKEIIAKILYITIASASKKGIPWNSPVYSAFDEEYNFYWASDKDAQHSRNIEENNKIFLVIYDSTAPAYTGEGVFIQAKAYELKDEAEIQHALGILYKRISENPKKREAQEFLGEYPRRVYKAVPEQIWMNADSEKNGSFVDIRVPVNLLKNGK